MSVLQCGGLAGYATMCSRSFNDLGRGHKTVFCLSRKAPRCTIGLRVGDLASHSIRYKSFKIFTNKPSSLMSGIIIN